MKKIKNLFILFIIICATNTANTQCFTSLSGGDGHIAARKPDGSLWAWGRGIWGALGSGNDTNNPLPNQLTSTSNWQSISTGVVSTFAIKNDGTLWGTGGKRSFAISSFLRLIVFLSWNFDVKS